MSAMLQAGRYFGSVVGRRRSGALTVTETRYSSADRIPPHRHDRPYFCLVVRGGYVERSGVGETSCRSDTVVFHPAGAEHADSFSDLGGACFNVECEPSWLADCGTCLGALAEPLYLTDAGAAWLARRLRLEVRAAGAHADLAIGGLSRALVASVARHAAAPDASADPAWLRVAIRIVEDEFARGPGLSELARRAGVHPAHLARAFRRRLGCSAGELVRRRRVEAAGRLLLETDRSLSEIAYETGFADQSHFARTFRRRAGLTPSEYRREGKAR